MGAVAMKRAFVLLFLLSPVAFATGPEFQHKDPIIQQEFENAYKDIRSVLPVTGNAKCIDSPTFCVDTTNHRVGVANATPSTLLHLSSGTLTIDGTAPGIAVGGSTFTVTHGIVSVGKQLQLGDGSISAPAVSFINNSGSGLYRSSSNNVAIAANGSQVFDAAPDQIDLLRGQTNFFTFLSVGDISNLQPRPNNTWDLGNSNFHFKNVWATNGTIQTSSSKQKKQIREIVVDDGTTTLVPVTAADMPTKAFNAADDPKDVQVPRGIIFKWRADASTQTANADIIGFLGDDLPQEAHALLPDGTRDPENFYTSAVVGIQSAAIRALQRRVRLQQRQIRRLETIVSEIETQLNVAVPDPDPGATQ